MSCAVEGCGKPVKTKRSGLCEMHYYRMRRTGTTADPVRISGPCSVDGCAADAAHLLGYCRMHYLRWRKHGDVHFTYDRERTRHWTGDDATASAAHQRVKSARGRASSWSCADCARPAAHWSYNHTDPDERRDPEKGPYSVNIDHYVPRCVPCHKVFDLAHIAACR